VRAAVKNSDLYFPGNRRLTVSLSPADIRKEGPAYDLPIAAAFILATTKYHFDYEQALFVGELSLEGRVRHTNGILPVSIFAREHGIKKLFLPAVDFNEANLVEGLEIFPVENLSQLNRHLSGEELIKSLITNGLAVVGPTTHSIGDMAFVKGQQQAKRALEIAAAGGHNVLMSGPPGSGKTLLARTLSSILPPLTTDEILEVTKIYSVAGLLSREEPVINGRPFRAPHHSSSGVALVGGGKFPRPGEISLAHRGVLFLDEFPEFPRLVLENLRQPLEDGIVTISRAQGTLTFPARFILVASQNPCPCGYATDPGRQCICSPIQISNYRKRISGPIIDRIDLHVEVPRVEFEKLADQSLGENSSSIRERVVAARERQNQRFKNTDITCNAEMRPQEIRDFCPIDSQTMDLLRNAVVQMHLSARSYHRILKMARTVADLAAVDSIEVEHVAEALQYRAK